MNHRQHQVRVNTTYTDLRLDSSAGVAVHLDTRPCRTGPEYVLMAGLGHGTDWTLVRARNWKPVGEPLTCRASLDISWAEDQTRVRIDRGCLKEPRTVRVAVKMVDHVDGSHPVCDWRRPGSASRSPWRAVERGRDCRDTTLRRNRSRRRYVWPTTAPRPGHEERNGS